MRKRGVAVTEALSLPLGPRVGLSGSEVCHVDRIAVREKKAGGKNSNGHSLCVCVCVCVCVALDGLWRCVTLCTTAKWAGVGGVVGGGGGTAAVMSLPSTLFASLTRRGREAALLISPRTRPHVAASRVQARRDTIDLGSRR